MRIRTIKPEFFMHDGLHDAEVDSKLPLRVAFAGLWCAADREGRFRWEPRRLGAQILPYDEVDFSRVLHALTTRGFIVKYRVNDACYGAIPSWHRHQIINNRERASDIPNYTDAELLDACPTRDPRDGHACHREGKGREGNKEGKGMCSAPPPADAVAGEPKDPRHHEITSQWGERFKRACGVAYSFDGKDAATLKRFLAGRKDTAEEILAIAERAWERSRSDRFAKFSKQAGKIHGFCTHFSDIALELQSPAPATAQSQFDNLAPDQQARANAF